MDLVTDLEEERYYVLCIILLKAIGSLSANFSPINRYFFVVLDDYHTLRLTTYLIKKFCCGWPLHSPIIFKSHIQTFCTLLQYRIQDEIFNIRFEIWIAVIGRHLPNCCSRK